MSVACSQRTIMRSSRRVVVSASVDADTVRDWCDETAALLGVPGYEGPFVNPVVNEDLVGPVPERVWQAIEPRLLAGGATLEAERVPPPESGQFERKHCVVLADPNTARRARRMKAFVREGMHVI